MARRVMLALCAAAVLVPAVAGCEGATEGTPATSTSAAQVALWNPCTEIPADVLRQTGVNPSDVESGIAGVHQSGWEICTWTAPKYFMTVFSTKRTVAEFRKMPENVDFRDVRIAGREGQQYRVEGAAKDLECEILFGARQGSVSVKISNNAGLDGHEDPCRLVNRVAGSLVPVFPA
ncbi:DUF3558 domain-containing protein [Nocardia xishanensis]|uniref:DUF3558 domain-containing protein n=1 Tax=Nocardia xishanensis TaxID=238964 RepID=UPI0033EABE94